MQLKIEFYGKDEYAIQYENDDQYPFASNYENDLFVFCCYTVRILQNFGTHPVGKILAALLKSMDVEKINKITNHEYRFPNILTLRLFTISNNFQLSPPQSVTASSVN